MRIKKMVRGVCESKAGLAYEKLLTKVWGIPYEVARNYDQMIWDEWEMTEGLALKAFFPNTSSTPEAMLLARHMYAAMYRRLHKMGLERTFIGKRVREAAAYWGRAYLRATGTNYSEQDVIH